MDEFMADALPAPALPAHRCVAAHVKAQIEYDSQSDDDGNEKPNEPPCTADNKCKVCRDTWILPMKIVEYADGLQDVYYHPESGVPNEYAYEKRCEFYLGSDKPN